MTIKHGTDRQYSDRCRCDDCREAHKIRAREYRRPEAAGVDAAPLLTAVLSAEREQAGLAGWSWLLSRTWPVWLRRRSGPALLRSHWR
jgi:hypothetical protein